MILFTQFVFHGCSSMHGADGSVFIEEMMYELGGGEKQDLALSVIGYMSHFI